jgi:hypothetical protein
LREAPLAASRFRYRDDAVAPARLADRLCSSFDTLSFSKNESESKKPARSRS